MDLATSAIIGGADLPGEIFLDSTPVLSQGALLALLFGALFILAFATVQYILQSLTLFSLGKRRGTKCYGLSWVPGLWVWTLGSIADAEDAKNGKDHKWRWVLLIFLIIVFVFALAYLGVIVAMALQGYGPESIPAGFIWPVLGAVLPMAVALVGLSVCQLICLYKLFDSCKPQKSVKLLLLAVLLPFAYPFVLISCRNWDRGVSIKNGVQAKEEETGLLEL